MNHAPTAVNDQATVAEDGSVEINVLSNDSDVDGDQIHMWSWDVVTPHGQVVQTPDRKLKYTPDPDYHGAETFSYTIWDNWGVEATATVSVTVTSVNDEVAAFNDAYVVPVPLPGPFEPDPGDGLLKNDIDFDCTPGTPMTDLEVDEVDATDLDGSVTVAPDGPSPLSRIRGSQD